MIIGSNFKLSNRKFLDDRQQCEGIEELNININGYLYPLGFEVYCIREGKWYQNTSKDENMPIWEERKGGVGEGTIDANGIIADGEILSNKTWSSEYINLVIDDIEILITENTDYIMEIEGRLELIEGSLEWLDTFDGSYNSLTDKPTIPTKVSELANDSGFAIHSQLESSGIFELKHSHENMETLQGITEEKVRQWDNVEGAAKIDDIVIANDTTWSSEKIHTTFDNYATENYVKNEIANAQLRNENGEGIDLSGFATKDDVPTRTSQLINDNNFISSIPSEYITEEELEEKGYLNEHQDISHLATKEELFSKDYNDLTNKPNIPTNVSELTNDSNFITEIPSEYITEIELNNMGYITYADITHLATKDELFSKDYNELTNKPTIPTNTSELTNDSDFITIDTLSYYATKDELFSKDYNDLTNKPNIPSLDGYATETYVTNAIANAQLGNGGGDVNIDLSEYATKEDLEGYSEVGHTHEEYLTSQGISHLATKIELNEKADEEHTHEQYLTEQSLNGYATETYVKSEIANAQLGGGDGNTNIDLTIYAKLSDLEGYSEVGHTHEEYLTEHQNISHLATKEELNTKADEEHTHEEYLTEHQNISHLALKSELFSKDYNDLTNKPNIPSIEGLATETYVTNAIANAQLGGGDTNIDLSGYATKEELSAKADKEHTHEEYLTEHQDISHLATKTELNTKADEEHTHSQYLTEIPSEYITEEELNAKNYLTEHQDISHLALKSELFNKDYNDLTNKPTIPSIEGLATETFVRNEIANAQLGGDSGEVDLSGYATKDELSAKADVDDIPTNVSQLTNDSGYITSIPSEYVTETELGEKGYLTSHQDISHLATKEELFSKDYNDLTNKPSIPSIEGLATEDYVNGAIEDIVIPTKVSDLTNDSNFISSIPSEYITETELDGKGYLTSHQNISHLATKDELHSHTNKTVIDGITQDMVTSWTNKSEFNGDYNSLTNKPNIPSIEGLASEGYVDDAINGLTIPTSTSQLTNDSNFISSIPSEYITEEELNAKNYLTSHQDISHLATKSELNAKADVSAIPTNTSQLTNDSNFITSIPSEYVTETELSGMGYLTSSDISHLATKDELHSHDNQEILDGITEEIINQWNDDNIDGGNASTVNGFSIWSGTQAEYDSIGTKSDTTIYLIRE